MPPVFLEYGKDSRFLIKVLTIIICILTGVVLLLGLNTLKRDVLYINPTNVIGTTKIGYIPPENVQYFAETFIYFLGNMSPTTVKEQYARAYALMSPKLQSTMIQIIKKEISEIEKSNIVIQTIPIEVVEIKQVGENTFVINVKANRVSYIHGQEGDKKTVVYTITCTKGKIKEYNPFGLEVSNYDFKNI